MLSDNSDNSDHPDDENVERRGSFRPQPPGTVPYEVEPRDTLEGIAARYNIMPSELTVLNRLSSRTVFPGQIIFIPERNSLMRLQQLIGVPNLENEPDSPRPGRVERVSSSDDTESEDLPAIQFMNESDIAALIVYPRAEAELEERNRKKNSLEINSKHVTDGEGVVSGILLVTPNSVMFDPNVSDVLVMEYGVEKYGVVAQVECIVRIALYPDIFRMRTRDSPQCSNAAKKVNIYHADAVQMKRSSSVERMNAIIARAKKKSRRSSSALETTVVSTGVIHTNDPNHDILFRICELGDGQGFQEIVEAECSRENKLKRTISCSSDTTSEVSEAMHLAIAEEMSKRKENQMSNGVPPPETDSEKPSADSENPSADSENLSADSENVLADSEKPPVSEEVQESVNCEPASTKKKTNFEKTKHKINKGLRKLSLTGDGLFSGSSRRMSLPSLSPSLPDFKFKNSNLSSNKKSKSLDDKAKQEASGSGTSYVNMVDDKPDLFVSFDKLIPKPAKSFDDTPLYLCLKMGRPIEKTLHRTTPVKQFGQKMKSEYWFSIPKKSVETLYKFILRFYPEKYGDVDEINFEELGFTSVDEEEEDEVMQQPEPSANRRGSNWSFPWKKGKSKDSNGSSVPGSSPEDWEFLDHSNKESEHEVTMPELHSPSVILSDDQILQIVKHLPARASSCAWSLIYSTAVHGFSLKTMYREMTRYDSPVIIAISNRTKNVFGAMLSCPLKMSEHFYGTGESFLFTFYPEFKCYPWSGENDYFIKGNTESFVVGASEGHFGLWLDDDLFRGHTNSCQTFNNLPLCETEDFVVRSLEAWGFV